jgi:group I intron endonuclease
MINLEQIYSKIITSDMKYSGIYLIINLFNNKFYVGSAKNLWERKLNHFRELKNNKHKNIYLQNSYNKHGLQYFIMTLIEQIDDKDDLIKREQYWIDTLEACNKDIAYNICPNAESKLGHKHSLETKNKMSKSMQGIKRTEEGKRNISLAQSNPIIQCMIDGQYIQEWESAKHVERAMNVSSPTISRCCSHKYQYAYESLWFYKSEYERENFDITKFIPKIGIKIKQLSLNGELIKIWDTYKDIRKEYQVNQTHIIGCCDGIRNTHKGFIWQYA